METTNYSPIWSLEYVDAEGNQMVDKFGPDANVDLIDEAINKSRVNDGSNVELKAFGHIRLATNGGYIKADFELATHMDIDGEDEAIKEDVFNHLILAEISEEGVIRKPVEAQPDTEEPVEEGGEEATE